MNNQIDEIAKILRDLAWKLGPRGIDGECCNDLTMPEYLALEKISLSCDCSVQSIGGKLGFTKSGATRVVNRLEKKGYVVKNKSNEDGRICCVALTEKGKVTLEIFNQFFLDKIKKGLESLTDDRKKELSDSLNTLLHNID